MSTRKDTSCPILGNPGVLKDNVLPTYSEVMKYFLFVKNDLLWKGNKRTPSISDICELVALEVEKVWKRASVPTVSHQQVISLIKSHNDKIKALKKIPLSREDTEEKRKTFQAEFNSRFFDIAACKCSDFSTCKCKIKIPTNERVFLVDQRTNRMMSIGPIDMASTMKETRKFERKSKEIERREKNHQTMKPTPSTQTRFNGDDNEDIDIQLADLDDEIDNEKNVGAYYQDVSAYHKKRLKSSNLDKNTSEMIATTSKQMRKPLPNLAIACDRAGVSDRSAAIIASSVLQDFGIVSNEESTQVIDRQHLSNM